MDLHAAVIALFVMVALIVAAVVVLQLEQRGVISFSAAADEPGPSQLSASSATSRTAYDTSLQRLV
jgi:hypothetical protein